MTRSLAGVATLAVASVSLIGAAPAVAVAELPAPSTRVAAPGPVIEARTHKRVSLSVSTRTLASSRVRVTIRSNGTKAIVRVRGARNKRMVIALPTRVTRVNLPKRTSQAMLRATRRGWTPSNRIDVHIGSVRSPQTSSPATDSEVASQILRLVNQARSVAQTCGSRSYPPVARLTRNSQLDAAASGHASDMAERNYFAHNSPEGGTPWQRIAASGYDYVTAGENIAAGYSTPASVVEGWMRSAGHCRNIMSPHFVHLGVGYYYKPSSSWNHYWVQNFGSRR